MATITILGNARDYFFNAFDNASLVSLTPTRVVIADALSGWETTFTGTDLSDPFSPPVSGTITSIETVLPSVGTLVRFTDISWSADTFVASVEEVLSQGTTTQLNGLLNQSALITVTGAQSTAGFDLTFGTTSPVNVVGSDFEDTLGGGLGNDTIFPGASDNGEIVVGTSGSDLIDFSGHSPDAWADLYYGNLTSAITASVNGPANTMSVSKASGGTDTIINARNVLQANGLNIIGTQGDDVFNADGGASSWMSLRGDVGDDIFNVTLTDTIRLNYQWTSFDVTRTGINANLATGQISDGLGGTDTLNVLGGEARLEIHATEFTDVITGSSRGESFILAGGDDVLDGGGGFDRVRYNRNDYLNGVTVDLEQGTAQGFWRFDFAEPPSAFTHTLSNIEEVRGSYENDRITGDSGDNRLYGERGNDTLLGGDGSDLLRGGSGNDLLNPGNSSNFDDVDPGSGNDTVELGEAIDGFINIQHFDQRTLTGQTVNINGLTNTASIVKGNLGTTTINDIVNPILGKNLGIVASALDDVFNITLGNAGGFLQLTGGRGNDTFNLAPAQDGSIEINFDRDTDYRDATQGVVANLQTGVVSNDGFGFQDVITGGNDVGLGIDTTKFADAITGSDSYNYFDFNGGNDTLDGGASSDGIGFNWTPMATGIVADLATGIITGTHETGAFTVSVTSISEIDGSQLGDVIAGDSSENLINGRAGDDLLYGDGFDVTTVSDISAQVYRLYLATLDRVADTGGHLVWTKALFEGDFSLSEVVAGFTGSQEFQNTYGSLSDAGFVGLMYQNVLARTAEQSEIDGWLTLMGQGTSREDVVSGFSDSTEFRNSTAAEARSFGEARSEAVWTDDIYRLYLATLAREADLGGLLGWSDFLSSGTASFAQAVAGFTGSQEFQNTYGSLSDAGFVELMYQNVLARTAEQSEIDGWLSLMGQGTSREDVVIGFAQAQEFRNLTESDLIDWVRDQGRHDEIEGREGTNTLFGGMLSDWFIFNPEDGGTHTVYDLEVWDELHFNSFGYGSKEAARANMQQQGADVVFTDQGVTITLMETTLAQISDDMIQI